MIEKWNSVSIDTTEDTKKIILSKANEFAKEIDSRLSAQFAEGRIDIDGEGPKRAVFLEFQHSEVPKISWSMEVPEDQNYLIVKFREAIAKIYDQQVSQLEQS